MLSVVRTPNSSYVLVQSGEQVRRAKVRTPEVQRSRVVRIIFHPITLDAARALATWCYPSPYDVYDMPDGPATMAEMLDTRSPWFVALDDQSAPMGYCCFGTAAEVNWEGEPRLWTTDDRVLSVGLGMRPDLTAQGIGPDFLDSVLAFATERFSPETFRLFVLPFNQRAIVVYEGAGFRLAGERVINAGNPGHLLFLEMRQPLKTPLVKVESGKESRTVVRRVGEPPVILSFTRTRTQNNRCALDVLPAEERRLMADTGQVTSGYADVNGAKLYYEVAGEGHPLVFLHAGIANLRMWDDQFSAFADRYRVVRYDHRSFGQSNAPAGTASGVDDVYGMLKFLNIDKAYLVGCSMGGGMALDFTLTHPEMVDGLVLVGPGVSGAPDEEEDPLAATWQELQAAAEAGDYDKANEVELRIWVDGIGRTPDQVDPTYRAKVSAMNRALYDRHKDMNAVEWQPADPPAFPRLESVTAPTLLIIGDRDVLEIQKMVDVLAARIPGARKVVMHNTAHLPSVELPGEFNQILGDFLGGLK